ncbi:lysoplasmalogenase [Sutcliffiella halmapala]|uniref:lysoplasmalogenase n=1 Tax=Sutcliffiella halmapala TaxID=79882 RepID=UPI0009954022|nr:lysoplasmalogenase [Sutcliffiella halmapala]
MPITFLSILIFLSAISYLLAIKTKNQTLLYILKPGTMLLIIIFALTSLPSSTPGFATWILVGLVLSLFGDIFLMLPKDRFLPGLIAFLLAHICYIIAFLQLPVQQEVNVFFTIGLMVVALFFFAILQKQIQKNSGLQLVIAVFFYIVLITAMVWCAVATANLLIIVGAVLFYFSDATLAWDRFVKPLKLRSYLVMSTYFSAQYLFALALFI